MPQHTSISAFGPNPAEAFDFSSPTFRINPSDITGGANNFSLPEAISGKIPSTGFGGEGTTPQFDFKDFLFGGKDTCGALYLGTQLLSGLAQYGLLSDQLDLAGEQFDFTKAFANRNLQNQAKTLNTQLRDRQQGRIATAGTSTLSPQITAQDLESYMAQSGLSEAPIA